MISKNPENMYVCTTLLITFNLLQYFNFETPVNIHFYNTREYIGFLFNMIGLLCENSQKVFEKLESIRINKIIL